LAKYGQGKYGTFKYGQTSVPTQEEDITLVVAGRMSSLTSPSIVTSLINIDIQCTKVRMKCNDGKWVETQFIPIDGNHKLIRIRSVGENQSPWVVAVRDTFDGRG
jgi:hypothetical protein